jgi:hypothetical protein
MTGALRGGPNFAASCQLFGSGNFAAGGASFGSPIGAPASTHFAIVAICASLRLRSFLNACTPTVLSMCHGGITRETTRALIFAEYFFASSYEISDIGAIEFG